ncbi:MAG: ComEC/Rec2 family competence protein [Syntrophales bacterium]
MSRPVIPLLIAFMAGIVCASLVAIPVLPVQLCLVTALLLILRELQRGNRGRALTCHILTAFVFLGLLETTLYLHPRLANNHISTFPRAGKIAVEGMIADNPRASPDKTELQVLASRIFVDGRYLPVSGRILLNIREPYPFGYGDYIRFQSRIRIPRNFGNPGGFDYERHLRQRGILARAFVTGATGFVVLRKETGSRFRTGLERFRNLIRERIRETAPGTEGMIIQAMILGDQKGIPREVMENFNRTGTTHIIAISGFNIGIVAIFSLFVIRLLLKSSEYILLRYTITRVATFGAIVVVILYTFIAGAGISVVRASLMVVLFMIAILINRERDLYNTLALAALVILIATPYSLFDISFQLSFVAVASLLFLTPRLAALLPPLPPPKSAHPTREEQLIGRGRKLIRGGVLFFFASLSATIGTLPLILLYFNRLSLIGLAANLIVVPILGVIAIPLCLFIVVAVPLSAVLAEITVRIAATLVSVSLSLITLLATVPWSSIPVPTPTLPEIGAFYLLLAAAGFWLDRRTGTASERMPINRALFAKIVPLFVALFFLLDGTWFFLEGQHAGRLTLTAVDVGQGSATLVRFPGGKRFLVDGGGFFDDSFDVGRYVLAPFLWKERITRIDTVVLTHPHPDHLQGLPYILEHFSVGEVWTNGDTSAAAGTQDFHRIIRERNIPLRIVSALTPPQEISGVMIRILNPAGLSTIPHAISQREEDAPEEPNDSPPVSARRSPRVADEVNDRSLVIKLSFGRRSFLLPGDISTSSELRLALSSSALDSDVLFVPHHGGPRSSTPPFLEKVNPRLAVISCGVDNVFRVPHPDVMRRLAQSCSHIYRTDRDGAVTIETDGEDLRVRTFRQRDS